MNDIELIAEFMGITGIEIEAYEPAYDNSWDWLIPVANKIVKLYTCNFGVLQSHVRKDESFIARMAVKNMFALSDITGQLELDSVYLRCVDFIKWYNKTTA